MARHLVRITVAAAAELHIFTLLVSGCSMANGVRSVIASLCCICSSPKHRLQESSGPPLLLQGHRREFSTFMGNTMRGLNRHSL